MGDNQINPPCFSGFVLYQSRFTGPYYRTVLCLEIARRVAFYESVIDSDLEAEVVISSQYFHFRAGTRLMEIECRTVKA
jgi:hypothetical protein